MTGIEETVTSNRFIGPSERGKKSESQRLPRKAGTCQASHCGDVAGKAASRGEDSIRSQGGYALAHHHTILLVVFCKHNLSTVVCGF